MGGRAYNELTERRAFVEFELATWPASLGVGLGSFPGFGTRDDPKQSNPKTRGVGQQRCWPPKRSL